MRILLTLVPIILAGLMPLRPVAQTLDMQWVFDGGGRRAMQLPRHRWLGDSVVLYDRRPEKAERRLQVVDTPGGELRDLVDAPTVTAAMNSLLNPEEPFDEIGWPAAFDSAGRRAAYLREGDILLLDLATASLSRVTDSDSAESAPRFSPNGQYLAFVRDNDLYVWDIGEGTEKRLTTDGSATRRNGSLSWVYWEEFLNRADRGYVWSPDSRAIAYLQSDESAVGEAHFVDFEPALPKLITQRHPKAGAENPRVRAGIVPVIAEGSTGTTWVDLGAYPYAYLPRVQWLPGSDRLAVQTLNRAQTVLDLFIAEVASGDVRHVLRETSDSWIDMHDDLHFIAGGGEFLWRSARDGYSQLYRYSLDGEVLAQVTSGERALSASGSPPGMDRAVSYIDEDAGVLFFTALGDDSTERHLYRVGLDGKSMTRVSREPGTHAIAFDQSGRYLLDAHSALGRVPVLQLRDLDGATQTTLAAVDSKLPEALGLQPWERFSVAARDGFSMPALLLKPRDFDPARRYPVLIHVYAGPSAPTVVDRWLGSTRGLYHQMLADQGVVVFKVDNRSAAGRSQIDAAAILRQLYGPVELHDLEDGVAWLREQSWVDESRIGIWGWSGGGSMTLSALTGSKAFAAGVAVAPVTDWRFYDSVYTERYMKRPGDNPDGYVASSLVERAAQLHGHLMLVHGTYDDNVHPQNTWAFADALIEEGILFDMLIYPMRKHGISDDAAQEHVYRSMQAFWQRQFSLPATVKPPVTLQAPESE